MLHLNQAKWYFFLVLLFMSSCYRSIPPPTLYLPFITNPHPCNWWEGVVTTNVQQTVSCVLLKQKCFPLPTQISERPQDPYELKQCLTSPMLISASVYCRPFMMMLRRAAGGTKAPLMLDWLMWLSIPNVYAECTNPWIYIDKKFYETKIVSM